jgi:hypothetical protein
MARIDRIIDEALARQHELPLLSRDGIFDFVPGLKPIEW